MSDYNEAAEVLLGEEGGKYLADDHGRGPCKWGITLKTYQEFYPKAGPDDIRALTRDDAKAFYKMAFWDRFHVGLIATQKLANRMLGLVVNVGSKPAIKFLQIAVGATPVDGILGPGTAGRVNARKPEAVLAGVRIAGEAYYRELARKNPEKYADCLDGWIARLYTNA